MSYQLIKEFNRVVWVKLIGKLTVSDFQELQALARLNLEKFGQFRALIELEDFQGWSKETGWENSVFLEDHEGSLSGLHLSVTKNGKLKSSCSPENQCVR